MSAVTKTRTIKYLSVYQDLKEAILSGKYLRGSFLPTEVELTEIYSVSHTTVRKAVSELLAVSRSADESAPDLDETERALAIEHLEEQMLEAAGRLEFEKAAKLRDQLLQLKGEKPMDPGASERPKGRRRPRKNKVHK